MHDVTRDDDGLGLDKPLATDVNERDTRVVLLIKSEREQKYDVYM